jgi:hypothetical protein
MTLSRFTLLGLPVVFATLAFAASARADVAPPNYCQEQIEGASCTNDDAGEGTCQRLPCGEINVPDDAGNPTTRYCYLCVAVEADGGHLDAGPHEEEDSGSQGDDAGKKIGDPGPDAATGPVDSGTPILDGPGKIVTPSGGGGGGCSVAGPGRDETVGGLMFGLGLVAYAFSLRKKTS